MYKTYKSNEKQLNFQRIVIVILLVILTMAFSFTVTYAIYSRTARDSATIRFSDPINVYISVNDETKSNWNGERKPLFDDNTRVFPGTRIYVKFGVQVGVDPQNNQTELSPSSDAFIKVKFEASSVEGIIFESGDLIKFQLTPFQVVLLQENWLPVDFSEAQDGSDIWWVHSNFEYTNEEDLESEKIYNANVVKNNKYVGFLEFPGDEEDLESETVGAKLIVNEKIEDKRFANSEIVMDFKVKAIQSIHVENPLLNIQLLKDANDQQVYIEVGKDSSNKSILLPVYGNATWGKLSEEE